MADNLESYFKKHLSDETPGEGNWNVPSDDVWNKALPEIQKKRGLFIPWKYLYIIGVLVIAGLAIIFWPSGTTDTPVGLEILSLTESASVLDRFDGSEGSNGSSGSSGSNDLADSSSSNSSLVSNASDDVGGTDGFDETNSSLGSNGSLVPFSSEAFEVQEDVLISKLTPLRINSIEIPYFLALSEIETLTKEAIVLDDL